MRSARDRFHGIGGCLLAVVLSALPAAGQESTVVADRGGAKAAPQVAAPAGYLIGPEDQLSILFWQDRDMSADVVVRPDGKISLPLLSEFQASGRTPEQLQQAVTAQAKKFMQEPNATVIVRQINSRKVFITGAVERAGTYPLNGPMTVLQLIAIAGGLTEYADPKNIVVVRSEGGQQVIHKFDYREFVAQRNMGQNIDLKPSDTVVVP